jgi:hypothetical protein
MDDAMRGTICPLANNDLGPQGRSHSAYSTIGSDESCSIVRWLSVRIPSAIGASDGGFRLPGDPRSFNELARAKAVCGDHLPGIIASTARFRTESAAKNMMAST